MSTFSVWPWTDAYNPGEPGGGRRAAALAADSATLHRLPVRRSNASCGLLQTNLYTPQQLAALVKLRSHLLTQITQNNNLTETISDKLILAIIEKTVSSLKKQADNLQKLIAEKIKSSPSLQSKVSRLQEVQGIGEITASSLLGLMPVQRQLKMVLGDN